MNKSALFLFVATYGRGINAALPPSCEENESSACNSSGDKCTPLGSEFEPTGNGQVWYSQCCTVSETSTDTPPVTESKKYCYAYTLQAWPSNQLHGIKPDCSENGQGNLAWTLEGQCKTDGVSCSSSIFASYLLYFQSLYQNNIHVSQHSLSLLNLSRLPIPTLL